MSRIQNDQVFPAFVNYLSAEILARKVSAALRRDYGDQPHAVKRLSALLGVAPRTVRNWYEARNIPSLLHFLQLARISANIAALLLRELKNAQMPQAEDEASDGKSASQDTVEEDKIYCATRPVYCATKLTADSSLTDKRRQNPNQRREWFLHNLRQGRSLRAADIVQKYGVSSRTARLDISTLVKSRLIYFVGARKTGWYEAV